MGSDIPRYCQGLLVGYWLHSLLSKAIDCRLVISKIELRSHQDNGYIWGVVFNLGMPLEFKIVNVPSEILRLCCWAYLSFDVVK